MFLFGFKLTELSILQVYYVDLQYEYAVNIIIVLANIVGSKTSANEHISCE